MLDYDDTEPLSIQEKGRKLVGNKLIDVYPQLNISNKKNKGEFGLLIEEHHYGIKANSDKAPDFPKAGVELKCAPLKKTVRRKYSAKERLVFSIINYEDIVREEFVNSSFWEKNQLLMLFFYMYEKNEKRYEHLIKYAQLWRIPLSDIKIIKEDWEFIVHKVKDGRAHELSEGDTFYLSACTKGSTAEKSMRSQPFSHQKAKQRAFSLKLSYVNTIVDAFAKGETTYFDIDDEYDAVITKKTRIVGEENGKYQAVSADINEPIITCLSQIPDGMTFSEYVLRIFENHYGKTEDEILDKYKVNVHKRAKNKAYVVSKAIFGVKSNKIAEFEKADIQLKTIRLESSGTLKESMSFPNIKYDDIVSETWEESEFYELITKKFLFVVFKKGEGGVSRLHKAMFWTIPFRDIEFAKSFWLDTKAKVVANRFNDFYRISDKKLFHVRPKGRNSKDVYKLKNGGNAPKMCYWMNSHYIKQIISD